MIKKIETMEEDCNNKLGKILNHNEKKQMRLTRRASSWGNKFLTLAKRQRVLKSAALGLKEN